MVAPTKRLGDLLTQLKDEYKKHPTHALNQEIANVEAKKKRKSQCKRAKTKAKGLKDKTEKPNAPERQEEAKNVDAWEKASDARIAADRAVEKLKSLRANATQEQIDAAKNKVTSRKIKATKLEIAAIFADVDAQAAARQMAEDCFNEGTDREIEDIFGAQDNSDLDEFNWPNENLEATGPIDAPEIFSLPTPAPTIASPNTGTASPVKQDGSVNKGTKEDPVEVGNSLTMAAFQQDMDYQLCAKAKFAKLLHAGDPIARLIDDFGKWLTSNGKEYVSRKGVTINEFLLVHLLDSMWLDGEILRLYAELLVQDDARFQVIPAHTVDWELRTLDKPEGEDTWASFDINTQATTLLIPTLVNTNHWMLCVGKINGKSGVLNCYNSLASFSQACQSAANDVVRVLLWFGKIPGSPIQGVTWTVNQCISGTQRNSDDCGVFVCANTAAVVLGTPIPQNVDGFRLQITSQLVKAARDETLDWDNVENMLAAASVSRPQERDLLPKFEREDQRARGKTAADVQVGHGQDDAGDGEVDQNEAEDDSEVMMEVMMETDHRCDICWYHYAPTANSLATHKRMSHNTEPFLCEWPGCRSAMTDQDAYDTHMRQIHERQMWICTVRTCHQRFATEAEAIGHLEQVHSGGDPRPPPLPAVAPLPTPLPAAPDAPRILDERYRAFDLSELRSMREAAIAIWKLKCESEDEEQRQVAMLYAAYHSPAPRLFFSKRGVLNQDVDAKLDHCSTIERSYRESGEDNQRCSRRYSLMVGKDSVSGHYYWWVIFLHQRVGSELDKFIQNAVLGGGWVEISHKCHWSWCFVASHLEQVLPMENANRTSCKNGSRAREGGCNALRSTHPHDHCFLGLPKGTSFDANLPKPIYATKGRPRKLAPSVGTKGRQGRNKRKWMDSEGGQETEDIKRGERQGPCAEGHTTTSKRGWFLDPNDRQTMLCDKCYGKVASRRGPCTECGRYVGYRSASWKEQNMGAKGFICRTCAG